MELCWRFCVKSDINLESFREGMKEYGDNSDMNGLGYFVNLSSIYVDTWKIC